MPTLEHNGLIEMFRENPALAPRFLALLFHVDVPLHASVRIADTSLDQLIPIEFRADLVLELRDEQHRATSSRLRHRPRGSARPSTAEEVHLARLRRRGKGRAGVSDGRLDREHAAVYF